MLGAFTLHGVKSRLNPAGCGWTRAMGYVAVNEVAAMDLYRLLINQKSESLYS